jgi:hypothetical protein
MARALRTACPATWLLKRMTPAAQAERIPGMRSSLHWRVLLGVVVIELLLLGPGSPAPAVATMQAEIEQGGVGDHGQGGNSSGRAGIDTDQGDPPFRQTVVDAVLGPGAVTEFHGQGQGMRASRDGRDSCGCPGCAGKRAAAAPGRLSRRPLRAAARCPAWYAGPAAGQSSSISWVMVRVSLAQNSRPGSQPASMRATVSARTIWYQV